MARDINDIVFRFLGDTKDLKRGTQSARRELTGTERAFSRVGKVATGAFALFAGSQIIDGARQLGEFAVNAAIAGEAVERVRASFEEIYGEAAPQLRESMDETRTSMGLSRKEFEATAIPIGLMGQNAGLAADESADLTARLVTLAGDVAAFNPELGDANQALGAMQAALRGEFDPLERFGSKLSAARVKAEMARLRGVDPLNAALSEQELQIMAVVSLLEGDLAPAMGTLAEMEGGAADNASELEARWKDLRDEGYRLASGPLSDILGYFADEAEELNNSKSAWDIFGQAVGWSVDQAKLAVIGVPETVRKMVQDSEPEMREFSDYWYDNVLGSITDTPQAVEEATNAINGFLSTSGDEIDEFTYRFQQALLDATSAVNTARDELRDKRLIIGVDTDIQGISDGLARVDRRNGLR